MVAAITPWHYPFYLNVCKVSAALAAGCTVVLKPAPDTPVSGLALGAIAAEHTDIPAGVLNVVSTSDNSVAQSLAVHPDVDAVTFTGSTVTGRRIMGVAADTVKRVTLESGGKSAAVLLDDAPLDVIVPDLAGAVCIHVGQACMQRRRPRLQCASGGYRHSGNGREWGAHGFEEYLETKAILGYGD